MDGNKSEGVFWFSVESSSVGVEQFRVESGTGN